MLIYPDSPEARERASRAVANGDLFAFRTDTFYGIGADPFNPAALEQINTLKGREGKPILVLAAETQDAERLIAERTQIFELLAARLWPGPLTLVATARANVPELLTAGTGTVGVRLPEDEECRTLVRACGGLLTAPSANPAGRPPARTAAAVAGYFPAGLSLVLDGGATRTELPSTVVDVTGARPRFIREGVVTRRELEEALRADGIEF